MCLMTLRKWLPSLCGLLAIAGVRLTDGAGMEASPRNNKEAAKIGRGRLGQRIRLRDFKAPAALLASPSIP
jgi:hypothetical protein